MSLTIQIGDLCEWASFGFVELLAVDIFFGMLFIVCCTRSMFLTKRKVVPWHSKPLAVITSKTMISLMYIDITIFNVKRNLPDGARAKYSICVALCVKSRYRHIASSILSPLSRCRDHDYCEPLHWSRTPMFHDCTRSREHSILKPVSRLRRIFDG